ncbi:MAG: hydroxyacid dehydrogenase [Ignavibacteriaceae bacterium]
MDILIPENITGKALDNLTNIYSIERHIDLWKDAEKFAESVSDAKAILIRNQTMVDKRIIDHACSLRIIGRAGVGYDNVDVEYASKKGIVVCYTPDGNTISTAELTIGLMLSLVRKIPSGDKSTKAGNWDRLNHLGIELHGKTLGIVGFGKIGKAVAIRAHSFGMRIIVNDKFPNGNNLTGINYEFNLLEELLGQSDIVTIHLPLNRETKNLFNQKIFNLMKPGSLLLNTSRGEIIVENDLIFALEKGKIKGAALDVRAKEPPLKSKLDVFANVILTPHVGGFTKEAQDRVISSIANDIDLVLRNKPAINYINFAVPKVSEYSND